MKHLEHPTYGVAVCGTHGYPQYRPHTHFSDTPTCILCTQWRPAVLEGVVLFHPIDPLRHLNEGDTYEIVLTPSGRTRSMVCVHNITVVSIERYVDGSMAVVTVDGDRWALDIGAC